MSDPVFESSSDEETATGTKGAASGGSSGSEDDSSEDDIDFEFPREDGTELLQFLHREVTNLSNMEDN